MFQSSEENYRKDPVSEGRESFSIYSNEDFEAYKTEEIELLFLKSALVSFFVCPSKLQGTVF